MATLERKPREQATLIFATPEQAREFTERVERKTKQNNKAGLRRPREILGEEIQAEIEQYGQEAVDLTYPWEHTPTEHQEVQRLVDVAFREDLPLALSKARQSSNYPRVIDLFHDVLTGEIYEILAQRKINRYHVSTWQWWTLGITVFLLTIALSLLLLMQP